MTDSEPEDGRRQRSARSRSAVIDALLAFLDEGRVRPSAAELAERAGVSERSVFRHFDDLEALAEETHARQFARVAPLFAAPSTDGSLAVRIAALVDQRTRLHARMANLVRGAAYSAATSPTMAAHVADRRRWLREQVAVQFAPELAELSARDRRLRLAALDAATSLEHLDYLRLSAGVGPRDLKAVLTATVTALVAPPSPTPTSQEPRS